MLDPNQRSGVVTILGEVNVGKSTLLNSLVKKNISITTHKANTTKKQIKGIRNYKDTQIIFIDTPGLYLLKGKSNRHFLSEIWDAVSEADVLCLVADSSKPISKTLNQLLKQFNDTSLIKPKIILLLNKIDKICKEQLLLKTKEMNEKFDFDRTFMISALKGDGITDLCNWLGNNLPLKQWSYPSNINCDLSIKEYLSEKTREIILLRIHDEIPYSIEVMTDQISKTTKKNLKVIQTIYVNNQRHRSILLGKKGETIKSISIKARKNIEHFLKKKIHLFLDIKIKNKKFIDKI